MLRRMMEPRAAGRASGRPTRATTSTARRRLNCTGALLLAAGMVATTLAGAQDRAAPAQAIEPPSRTPLEWVQAMQQAATRVNFSGTIVYQSGTEMRTSRILHMFDGTNSHERVQTLDGKPREFIRLRTQNNDEVQCLFPESRRIVIEHRAVEEPFPGLIGASPEAILERYELKVGVIERVAGVECQIMLLKPRDALRYGYRLCAERLSGLLLKAQTLGEKREVLEQVAFTDVRIGERIARSQLKPSWSVAGWTIERSDYRRVDLEKAGWIVPTPDGFRRTKEVARRLGTRDAMQVVFTDGMATLSVFIEPKGASDAQQALAAPAAPAPASEPTTGAAPAATTVVEEEAQLMGPTAAYSMRLGEAMVTVVGEVPPAAVRAVARSVEFRGGATGQQKNQTQGR